MNPFIAILRKATWQNLNGDSSKTYDCRKMFLSFHHCLSSTLSLSLSLSFSVSLYFSLPSLSLSLSLSPSPVFSLFPEPYFIFHTFFFLLFSLSLNFSLSFYISLFCYFVNLLLSTSYLSFHPHRFSLTLID